MDAEDEAAARASYLAAFESLGECPCRRGGERMLDYRARVGEIEVGIWDCARFHPDPAERELALLAGCESLRRGIRGLNPYEPPLPGGYAADRSDNLCDRENSIRMSSKSRGLAKLEKGAAKVGVAVTSESVRLA